MALPVHGNAVFPQQLRRDPIPDGQGAGKTAVIDFAAATGGASLLQNRRLAARQAAQPQRGRRAPALLLRHIRAGVHHHAPLPPL